MRIKTFKSLLATLGLVLLTTLAFSNVALAQEQTDTAASEAMDAPEAAADGASSWPSADEAIVAKGKELFNAKCNSCHELNKKVTGPALANISDKRSQDWLYKWIRNNEELRKSGDADAIAIYEEYGGSPMTVFGNLKDAEIDAIVAYTKNSEVLNKGGEKGPEIPTEAIDPVIAKRVNTALLIIGFFILFIVVLILEILNLVARLTGKEIVKWNNVNAVLMLLFVIVGLAAAFWEFFEHGKHVLPDASTEHGAIIDNMFSITFIITGIVFVITQLLLFGYAFVYRKQKGRKAYYYPHNNKLEVIWTAIPAVVLTVLVLYGLQSWDYIMSPKKEDNISKFEIFAFQFGWKARVAGNDGEFGEFNYNLISGTNPLGLGITEEYEKLKTEDIPSDIKAIEEKIAELEALPSLTDEQKEELEDLRDNLHLKNRHLIRLGDISSDTTLFNEKGYDDIIMEDEIHLMVNQQVNFRFRARDVIHSAYMPYFRLQMNCVPGMPTEFTFTPTKSTAEMREMKNDDTWDYYLFCAKICGSAHYNMKMKVVVHKEEERAEYDKWMSEQVGAFAKYRTKKEEKPEQTADGKATPAQQEETTKAVALVK